jgi:hypothetical protein
VRTLDRKVMIERALTVSTSLEIYGSSSWKEWQQFAPFYRGFKSDPRELDEIYQTTRINLHNGCLAMHYRVLDALAVGGFIMISRTRLDSLVGGILTQLVPYEHYGPFDIADTAAETRAWLNAADQRGRISCMGREAVLDAHTWRHRAAQILNDCNLPRRPGQAAAARQSTRQLQRSLDALEPGECAATSRAGPSPVTTRRPRKPPAGRSALPGPRSGPARSNVRARRR